MTIEEIKNIKKQLGWTNAELASAAGIPISTVAKILGGTTKNPRQDSVLAMERAVTLGYSRKYFYADASSENRSDSHFPDASALASHKPLSSSGSTIAAQDRSLFSRGYHAGEVGYRSALRESSPVWGSSAYSGDYPHVYTLRERENFPDERRTEIINGVLYDMAAPSTIHQDIAMEIYKQLSQCIRDHNSMCRVYIAPTDVCIDEDEYTVVQPDVFIICDRKKITRKNIQGAPDFILEVFSPSTRWKDLHEKFAKYTLSGVKEYWMIDSERKQVLSCDLRKSSGQNKDSKDGITIYGFSDKIPLLISKGKCIIDMEPIRELLSELYEF